MGERESRDGRERLAGHTSRRAPLLPVAKESGTVQVELLRRPDLTQLSMGHARARILVQGRGLLLHVQALPCFFSWQRYNTGPDKLNLVASRGGGRQNPPGSGKMAAGVARFVRLRF
jgi:hypothetical protein